MLGRCLSAAGCVVMCSLAVWPGCGGVEESPARSLRDGDAGGRDSGGIVEADSGSGTSQQDSGPVGNSDASTNVDSGLPPPVTIKYGTCPAFTPCGGDVVGTWKVTGGCLSEDTFAEAKQPPCQGVQESDVVIKAAGVVIADGTKIKRKTTGNITAKLAIPEACAEQAQGNCAFVQYGLTNELQPGTPPLFDTATCTSDGAGGCNCTVARAISEDTESAYTVAGNTLTSTDPTRTFDYCVDGTKNAFKETTGGSFPMVVELTK